MPAAAWDLVTWAYMVANYEYTTSQETAVQVIISAISRQAINIADNDFISTEYTEYQDGDCKPFFVVKHRPIISVDSIWISSDRTYDSDTLIDSDDYRADLDTGKIRLYEDVIPLGFDTLKYVYTAGYDTVPTDVQQAVGDAIDWAYKQRNNQNTGLESQTFPEGITTVFQTTFPRESLMVLMKYRVQSV